MLRQTLQRPKSKDQSPFSRNPNPRIQPPIHSVSQHVGNYVGETDHEHATLDDTIVTFTDTVFDEQQSQTRPAEDFFGNDRAGQQDSEL